MKRLLGLVCLLGMLTVSAVNPLHAALPTVVLSIKSVEEIMEDADFVGESVGKENLKGTAEASLDSITNGAGLAGIDEKKPLGMYWDMAISGADEIGKAVLFLPVDDPAEFKKLIESLVPDLTEKDGLWSMTVAGTPVFAKISNDYCFASTSTAALAKPSDPTKIVNLKYDISVAINVSDIPKDAKTAFLQTTESEGRKAIDNGPKPDSDAELAGQNFGFDMTLATLKAITNDGDRFTFGVDVNRETKMTSVDFSLTAKPNSTLAKSMAVYGKTTPEFAAVAAESAPFRLIISHPTSGMAEQTKPLFDAMRKTADEEIDKDESLKDAADKKAAKSVATRLFNIAQATINSGSVHSVIVLEEGEKDTVRIVAGTKLAKGDDAGKLVDDVVKLSKESPDLANVQLDVAKHAGARIHAITPDLNEKQDAMFGEGPAHLAIRPDSLWLSIGGGNLDLLKSALDATGKKSTKASAPISLRMKPATLVTLLEDDDEELIKRAETIAGQPGDVMNIEILPIDLTGAKLHLEFGMDLFKLGADSANAEN